MKRGKKNMSLRRMTMIPIVAIMATTFTGCAVAPVPVTDQERASRIHHDMDKLFTEQEPISAPLTLYDAMARALKYNYDARLKLMEEAFANAQLDLSYYDMLPKLTTSAGYASRSNDALSTSVTLVNGMVTPINPPIFSGAVPRSHDTQNAVFSWNILDFGVSYVRAEEQAEQTLVANERKRKVVQNIMQDVRQSYWLAYGAQKTLPHLDEMLSSVKNALEQSRNIEKQHLMSPVDALTYQRELIDLYLLIIQFRQDLVLAKTKLAALIGARPGTEFKLAGDDALRPLPDSTLLGNIDALDRTALALRPELREEDYRKRISVLEARKALLSLLPGIEFYSSANRDSNKYLYQNSWNEAGATVSFNLFRAFSYPATKRQQEAQAKLDDARRLALSMAVLVQVRIAAQRYHNAAENFEVSSEGADVDAQIENHLANDVSANAASNMALLRARVKATLSGMQRYVSYAELQSSYARIANSIGIDMLPASPDARDLKSLSKQLAQIDVSWQKNGFVPSAGPAK